MGYPDPICPTKEATDANFDEGVAFAVEHIDRMEIFMGSHNETSNYRLARLMDEKGLERNDRRIFFAQLHGMGDHISFNLAAAGYNVVKYVPYARVRDVLPYLIRRAEENTSMAGADHTRARRASGRDEAPSGRPVGSGDSGRKAQMNSGAGTVCSRP